ncbi:MAG: PDZ domain-containing protein [Acidobacteriota bacterium]
MEMSDYRKLRIFSVGLIGVALILFFIGAADIRHTPYLGYHVSPTYAVVSVDPSSPAAEAGLLAGDQVLAVNGVSTDKLFQLSQQERSRIGEAHRLTVLRGLTTMELLFVVSELPSRERSLAWAGNFLALLMLALGIVVFGRKPNKPTLLFFLSSFCLSLAFMTPPYLESFVLQRVVALNFLLFLSLGLAFFLHLSVVFPKAKPPVADTPVEILIYLPVPMLAVFFVSLWLFQPWADLRLNQFLHYAFGLAVLYCLGLALAAIIHSFWKRDPALETRGLSLLLVGALVGIVPPAVGVFFDSFFPAAQLPGREYYPLTVILASLAFAWVLSRHSFREAPGVFRHAA